MLTDHLDLSRGRTARVGGVTGTPVSAHGGGFIDGTGDHVSTTSRAMEMGTTSTAGSSIRGGNIVNGNNTTNNNAGNGGRSSSRPGFLTRVFRRMRAPRRLRGRSNAPDRAALTEGAAAAAAAVVTERLPRDEPLGLAGTDDDYAATISLPAFRARDEDECWSESEIRGDLRRDYGSFARRNDTDIDAVRPSALRTTRMVRDADDAARMLRGCQSSVTLPRRPEWEMRLLRAGGDRRRPGSDRVEGGSGGGLGASVSGSEGGVAKALRRALRGEEDVDVGSRCNSDPVMVRGEASFQSSNSSMALSVSSVTQASRSSSAT